MTHFKAQEITDHWCGWEREWRANFQFK